jgi:hypothetical protein
MSAIDPAEFARRGDETPGATLPAPVALAVIVFISVVLWAGLVQLALVLFG